MDLLVAVIICIQLVGLAKGGLKDWRNCPITMRRYFPASHVPLTLNGRQGSFVPRPGAWNQRIRRVGMSLEDLYFNRDDIVFGTNITWGLKLKLDEEINNGTLVKVDLYRDLSIIPFLPFSIRMPCSNGLGSCVYDACGEIQNSQRICDYMTRNGEKCSCPVKARIYEVYYDSIVIPILNGVGASLVSGVYRVDLRFIRSDGTEMGCIQINRVRVAANPMLAG